MATDKSLSDENWIVIWVLLRDAWAKLAVGEKVWRVIANTREHVQVATEDKNDLCF